MDAALARQLTYPNGWSLETSVLLQVPQLLAPETYCQVDLCARYDHRHQPLQSVTQPVTASATSLTDAAQEIIQRILQAAPGPVKIELLAERYNAHATQARRRYQNLAHINGLTYDAADEAQACAVFAALMWPLRFRD
jgi:glucosyl-3-phosphoglycerate synthase